MRTLHTQYPLLTLVSAALAASGANAATISGGSIVSNVSAPGQGSASTSVGVSASPTLLKFVGDIELTTTTGGTSLDNTLDISGNLTLDPQDAFILSYDFSASLVGGGTVTLTVTGTTDFGGVMQTISNVETITTPGDFNFNFSELGTVATETQNGTWSGQLDIDWQDAPAGASLNVTIPNDSIDFEVAAVPEPSHSLLLLLGSVALLRRRRL